MKAPIYFPLLISLLFLHCESPKQESSQPPESPEEMPSTAEEAGPFVPLTLEGIQVVGGLEKVVREDMDEMILSDCERWQITPDEVPGLLAPMRQVTSEAWYSLCYQLGCEYKGQISLQGHPFDIMIGAGGYARLVSPDTTYSFILETESDAFLAICDCCEYGDE